MATLEHSIDHNARLYLGLYGDNAPLKARKRATVCRDKGDFVSADLWRQVVEAIEALLDLHGGGPG